MKFAVTSYFAGVLTCLAMIGGTSVQESSATQDVKAVTVSVVGPKEVKAGNLVTLEASGNAQYKQWTTDNDIGKSFEGGKYYVFATPKPGVYKFVLIGNSDGAAAVCAWHTVTITGSPTPPGPDPIPVPLSISNLTKQWKLLVTSDNREAEASRLAAAFDSIAAQVAAGTLSDPDEIVKKTLEMNTIALGSAKPAWVGFFIAMREELNHMDNIDYAQVWSDIATGLKDNSTTPAEKRVPYSQPREYLYFTFTGCKACVKMKPIIMDMKSSGAVVTIVELEKSPGVVKQYGVTHYPTVVALELGSEVGRTVGETTRKAIESLGKK